MRKGRLERRVISFISTNQPVFIKNVSVPQISKKTDSSPWSKVAWFGLPQSVKKLFEEVLLFPLLQTGKLRFREVKEVAQGRPASKPDEE